MDVFTEKTADLTRNPQSSEANRHSRRLEGDTLPIRVSFKLTFMRATAGSASDQVPAKPKLFILTNMLSPYRMPLFECLSGSFDLTIVVGKAETNRPEWAGLSNDLAQHGITLHEAKGSAIQLGPDKFLHVNPRYLKILFSNRPAAVISLEMGFRSMCALIYCRLTGTPLWIWSGGTPFSERKLSRIKRFLRRIFVRSRARWVSYGLLATEYLASIGVTRNLIAQIQNAVDERMFSPEGPRADFSGQKPTLLVVGQLIDRKGLQQLLEAAARVKQRGFAFSLKLIGSGHKRDSLMNLASELHLDNVEFLGGVKPKEMPSYYRGADALVFPTLEDIWGLVVNEAVLCGLPVECSRFAGCSLELLQPENIFDPLEQDDFDAALVRAVQGETVKPDLTRLWPMHRVADIIRADITAELARRFKN